jgi:hypothetical protein
MGREAVCRCNWGGKDLEVKARIEGSELILRATQPGGQRRRIPLASLSKAVAKGRLLNLVADGEKIALDLGEQKAERWAKAFLAPPPTLAAKLGIDAASRILLLGQICGPELEAAVAHAEILRTAPLQARPSSEDAQQPFNLVIACVRQPAELERAAALCTHHVPPGVPVWIVYAKGAGQPVSEADVRLTLLAAGFVDTKVASVSATHTGLKFTPRKPKRWR